MEPATPVLPAAAVRTPYEHRLALVSDVLTRNSITTAGAGRRLAIEVLHALDHVPERVR